MKKRVVVIGGGAAGFFSAINIAEKNSNAEIIIAEKTQKILSKVKVSGGGRCNVTHECFDLSQLVKNYPRGEKELKSVFWNFDVQDTINWFAKRGVELHTEEDGRMFPVTNNSQTVIDCFLKETQEKGIKIWTGCEITGIAIRRNDSLQSKMTQHSLALKTNAADIECDFVIVTSGGSQKASGYDFISALGHKIISPVPSLFTINLPKKENKITELMGVAVKNAQVKIAGSSLNYKGPVLITHWGFSGPAVLKLSAFAARIFHEKNYKATVLINWTGLKNEEEVRSEIADFISAKTNSFPLNTNIFRLPERLWTYLLERSGIKIQKNWSEQNRKALNKLVSNLFADMYEMEGKTTFKEEFVTCGGVNLEEVDLATMESKKASGIFFAGEVLNIDGITGGFNFQSAWSTAFLAAQSVTERMTENK